MSMLGLIYMYWLVCTLGTAVICIYDWRFFAEATVEVEGVEFYGPPIAACAVLLALVVSVWFFPYALFRMATEKDES